MKNKYYLCSIIAVTMLSMPQTSYAQSPGENYIVTETMLNETGTRSVKSVQYYDGLGRPSVLAAGGANTSGKYLYTMTEYDNMGRESKTWLPAVGTTSPSIITASTMSSKSNTTYQSDGYAFSEITYDALGRPTFRSTPGKLWKNKNKGIKTEYITNVANSVRKYALDSSGNPSGTTSYYPAASLTGERVTDEDDHVIETYKDLLGNVVLERRKDGTANNDTYYVYDRGLLRVVIPPLYQTVTSNKTDLLYKYEYDGLGRCTKKTLPGNVIINYWYDRYGRVSFMQDGRMKSSSKFRFYLYDGLNRLAVQGVTTDTIGKSGNSYVAKVVFGTAKTSVGNTGYYIEGAYTIGTPSIEVVNYYDGYDFLNAGLFKTALNGADFSKSGPACATTLQTGSIQSTSDGRYLCSVLYYDERGRVTDSRQTTINGAVMSQTTTYSFTNQPLQTVTKLKMGYMVPTVTEANVYDTKSDKLTSTSLNFGNAAIPVASITYDDLGRVKTRNSHGGNIRTSYTYDLHGWLTELAATKANGSRLFQEDIHYADNSDTVINCYNGNISMVRWLSGDNPMGQDICNGYTYTYDGLNRLTKAAFGMCPVSVPGLSTNNDMGTVEYAYNPNSSITSLTRYGKKDVGYGIIDRLTYLYNGNQLKTITDTGSALHYDGAFEFSDANKAKLTQKVYDYDACGSMTYDPNRGITKIDYDLLGNPVRVQFCNGNVTEYVYSAAGTRLQTTHKTAVSGISVAAGRTRTLTSKETLSSDVTYYMGNFIYTRDGLRYNFADGYTDGTTNGYHYYIRDHQGNNRVVAKYDGTIEQTTHYYPYGGILSQSTNQGVQKYKYNGKEYDTMHGLNMYDYGARQQDPAVGMFTSMDPLCEKYYNVNPYMYCAGNPVRYVDPTGMAPTMKEAALMEAYVYHMDNPHENESVQLQGGWAVCNDNSIRENLIFDSKSGYKAELFSRVKKNGEIEYAYVYAGTEITSGKDWENNFAQVIGVSTQYDEAQRDATQLVHNAKNNEVSFVGHSLGGGLAALSSFVTGKYAITFNAVGLSAPTMIRYYNKHAMNIDAYVHYRDELNNTFRGLNIPTANGRVHIVFNDAVLVGHKIKNFYKEGIASKIKGATENFLNSMYNAIGNISNPINYIPF